MNSVSFDFDGTLSTQKVQEFAKELIELGVDVWVITTRYDALHNHLYKDHEYRLIGYNDDLWEVVDRLGIPREKVMFTNYEYKAEYLCDASLLWHLDDNPKEKDYSIIVDPEVILLTDPDWKTQCENILKQRTVKVED